MLYTFTAGQAAAAAISVIWAWYDLCRLVSARACRAACSNTRSRCITLQPVARLHHYAGRRATRVAAGVFTPCERSTNRVVLTAMSARRALAQRQTSAASRPPAASNASRVGADCLLLRSQAPRRYARHKGWLCNTRFAQLLDSLKIADDHSVTLRVRQTRA